MDDYRLPNYDNWKLESPYDEPEYAEEDLEQLKWAEADREYDREINW